VCLYVAEAQYFDAQLLKLMWCMLRALTSGRGRGSEQASESESLCVREHARACACACACTSERAIERIRAQESMR